MQRASYRVQSKYKTVSAPARKPGPLQQFTNALEDLLPYWVPRVRVNIYWDTSNTVLGLGALALFVAILVGTF